LVLGHLETDTWCWGPELVVEDVLGAPCNNFARRHRALSELLSNAERFADREYLVQGDRRLTFGDHERAVASVADAFADQGVRAGVPVLLYGANAIEWVVSFWAILRAGAIVVLGNAWWSDDELAHALVTSEPALIVGDARRLEKVPADRPALSFEAIADVVARGRSGADPGSATAAAIDEDDPAIILFTSGTTGMPNGAVLSHRGIIATLQALLERTGRMPVPDAPPPPPSAALLSLPLFHIGGLQQIITPVVTGGSLVFTEGRFDPDRIVELIEREGVKIWSAVPTMVTRVINHLEAADRPPLRGVRTVGLGGSPVPQELRERVLDWFPDASRGVAVTYGLSEACGVVATGAGADVRARPGSVGRPLVTATIRIADPDETGTGEVLVRSPSVMLGYWQASVRSSAGARWDPGPVDADRWLHTGDIGRLDDDGFLFITDRSKDIVIRGGENIATPHVEGRLSVHPAVQEVAVIGLPHPTLGEELGAVVVLRRGAEATEADLAAFAAETLAYFEVPSRWWFHPGPLPQNATGKIVKRALRQEWLSQERGSP
jgi:long-chain acyl-CoA synthetase